MILKPAKEGKVIINYKGKQVVPPVEATEEILNIPAVKVFLAKGILELVEEEEREERKARPILVKDLPLEKRVIKILTRAGYETIDQLKQASDDELIAIKGIAEKTVEEIREVLKNY